MATKRQIISKHQYSYRKASKKKRTEILDSLEFTTGLSRDHLARVLHNGYKKKTT